jgi:hypothetical protein
VRRLRRILPGGSFILVCFWADESDSEAVKALLATAEADAYAISLQEAVEICIEVATGKLKGGEVVEEPAPPSVRESRQRPSPSGVSGRRRVKSSWDD